uniref:GAF domain-containing protein n=1 Tax=Neobodo designis TaxID=312471 RepID=A0A7S1QFA9_NEODS
MAAPATASSLRDEIARLSFDADGALRNMSADERRNFAPLFGAAIAALKAELPVEAGSPNSDQLSTPQLPSLVASPRGKNLGIDVTTPSHRIPKPPGPASLTPRGAVDRGAGHHLHAAEQPATLSLGQGLAAGLYLLLESLQVRIQAARLTVVLKNPSGGMSIAVDCGGPQAKLSAATKLPLQESLLNSVMETGMAASLPTVSLEDIEDRTAVRPRNALALPLHAHPPKTGYVGVIIAINCRGGAAMFSERDERVLFSAVPSISYLTQTYDMDFRRYAFDPTPLHRYAPLPVSTAHGDGEGFGPLARSLTNSLAASKSDPPPILVYRREGPEKFIRKEHLRDLAAELPEEGDESHLVAVSDHIERVEQAWAAAIERCMLSERTLRQKQALVTEAVEVLGRKQRKVDLLKEVLADNLKTPEEIERDAARAAAAATIQAAQQRTGVTFRSALAGSGAMSSPQSM